MVLQFIIDISELCHFPNIYYCIFVMYHIFHCIITFCQYYLNLFIVLFNLPYPNDYIITMRVNNGLAPAGSGSGRIVSLVGTVRQQCNIY